MVYLGELRVSHRREIAGLWRSLLRERIAALLEQQPARYAYCCIMRGNHGARAAVLRGRRADGLAFAHLRGYASVALLARKPRLRRPRSRLAVRRATIADTERLLALLDADARERVFGVVFDAPSWARRLALWPSFGIESFYLAFDARDTLLGCLAPWDSSAVNRVVIERLPATARYMRAAYNALTPLTGKPRIPADSDSHLPDIWLTHVAVRKRDPEIFAALLDAAYADLAANGRYATVSLCAFDADPLAPALDRYWRYSVPMDVYWLQLDSTGPAVAAAFRCATGVRDLSRLATGLVPRAGSERAPEARRIQTMTAEDRLRVIDIRQANDRRRRQALVGQIELAVVRVTGAQTIELAVIGVDPARGAHRPTLGLQHG